MEDYKKKYEDLRKKIEHLCESVNSEWKQIIECYIPELKESEDERMIKSFKRLINAYYDVNFPTPEGFERKDMIAWLEKQGSISKINEKLRQYREYLVKETERWHKNEEDETLSKIGKQDCIGHANAYISARTEFEDLFNYDSWLEKKGEQKTTKAITVIERDGEQWIRVCALGEDFIIAAHNYKEGEKTKFTWKEACKIGTFSKKQGHIILALLDEINVRLEEIGGEPLDLLYWSSSEYSQDYAWFVLFGSGSVDINGKCYSNVTRKVVSF